MEVGVYLIDVECVWYGNFYVVMREIWKGLNINMGKNVLVCFSIGFYIDINVVLI